MSNVLWRQPITRRGRTSATLRPATSATRPIASSPIPIVSAEPVPLPDIAPGALLAKEAGWRPPKPLHRSLLAVSCDVLGTVVAAKDFPVQTKTARLKSGPA